MAFTSAFVSFHKMEVQTNAQFRWIWMYIIVIMMCASYVIVADIAQLACTAHNNIQTYMHVCNGLATHVVKLSTFWGGTVQRTVAREWERSNVCCSMATTRRLISLIDFVDASSTQYNVRNYRVEGQEHIASCMDGEQCADCSDVKCVCNSFMAQCLAAILLRIFQMVLRVEFWCFALWRYIYVHANGNDTICCCCASHRMNRRPRHVWYCSNRLFGRRRVASPHRQRASHDNATTPKHQSTTCSKAKHEQLLVFLWVRVSRASVTASQH